jgi:23S rRNA (cytidine1920-2'-O)/16S rRNA (cytidine1409-2'-O)-methyltransferase
MARKRIDATLVDRGLFESRERARAAILAGEIRVGDRVAAKAGELVAEDAVIEVAQRPRFVSRGGDKLAGALSCFGVTVVGRRAVDVGASTGGFTDCLLQEGAVSVTAVDVGYGQLAWSLRNDDRVAVFERTNIRHADPAELGAPFELVVTDVSFISLKTVLPSLVALATPDADLLALVKPQFELGKGRVGKRGVVRAASDHVEALESATRAARELGLVVRGMTFSPIKGPEGNIEFWLWASRLGSPTDATVEEVVDSAHEKLGV